MIPMNHKKNIMKKIILLLAVGLPVLTCAQTNQAFTLSLKQAMELGLKNRFDRKVFQYNIPMAENDLSKSKKGWIPEVQAAGDIQYTTQIQPTYIPKGFVGFGEPGLLTLGAKNMTVFGLSLVQPLFKPGINTNVKIAETNLALQKVKIRGDEMDIKNKISLAYLDVLLKRLQFQIAENEEARFKEYEELAAGKYKMGTLIENDYLRAKLDYKNAKVKTAMMSQNDSLAMDYLKYQINIPEEDILTLSDSIETIRFDSEALQPESIFQNRTEIKQLELQRQENKLQLKKVRQNALPSVSFTGYYAGIYQNQDFHYNESKWWAPHSYLGLQFSIPITSNFINKNEMTEYELRQDQLELELQQEKSAIQFQIRKASDDLQNAKENMQNAKENYSLSQTIYKNQRQQFTIGVFRYSDLLETEKSLDKAEQIYIEAVYEYLIAQVAYEKATGSL
jgi:outer membrane protein TolC